MRRRTLLGAALALPSIAAAQGARVLRFVPSGDLAALDPIWTTASQTRDHAFMVYDTLYGQDDAMRPSPQMLEGHVVENDGLLWKLRLRDGLVFHDGAKVLARDCAASIRRWGARDSFGQALMAATDEITAPDDRMIVFRLKYPFPLLPDALSKTSPSPCVIMPERLAAGDAYKPITDPTGSGPFRFKADERVAGARAVWERFAGYVPREGKTENTAGAKIVHFDRVEWTVMPDGATASAALQRGEVDWLRLPLVDLLPQLRRANGVTVGITEPTGSIGTLRFNHLNPPFDNPAIRRAVLPALVQADYMLAVNSEDRSLWRDNVGYFCPGTPLASDAGMAALTTPRDLAKARAALAATPYAGEAVVVMSPSDNQTYRAMADVTADLFKKVGFTVQLQSMDWATLVQRRARPEPIDKGGWSIFHTNWSGADEVNPAAHIWLRGNGKSAAPGWPTSPAIESLRDAWLRAPDFAAQQRLTAELQVQAFADVPYIPLGQMFGPMAWRSNITGMLQGPLFWNVRRG
jgi:peptide/nickel transport system substrate-binding protein